MARGDAIRHYLSSDGRNSRDTRVHFGARTDLARLADSPDAPDLSSDAQLLHLEGDLARGERCMGELGQTRTHCVRSRASLSFETRMLNDDRRTLISVIFAVSILALVSCKREASQSPVDPNGRVEVVLPEHGAYTGAFMDFGDEEDDVTLEIIEDFETMVGKHQAIIASSSYWGEQSFPTANLNVVWRHGSLPLVFWSPWDRPYEPNRGPDKFNLNDIIAGKWDAYIDKWTSPARDFGHPLIVAFGVEMNGDWFPWSGIYYGLDPTKPIMIAEWATGEFPLSVNEPGIRKTEWIKQGLDLFRTRYPRVKAAVYWHERWQNPDQSYSNLRVNSSVESLNAYREGVSNADWLGNLILRPVPKSTAK